MNSSSFFLVFFFYNTKVYPIQMKNIFKLANSTQGLNAQCIASFAPKDQWQCNFAQHAYAHTKSHTFPLNSALDSWQTQCIYTSELVVGFPHQTTTSNGNCANASGWAACAKNPETCSTKKMILMNQYLNDFNTIMNST